MFKVAGMFVSAVTVCYGGYLGFNCYKGGSSSYTLCRHVIYHPDNVTSIPDFVHLAKGNQTYLGIEW